VRRFVADGRWRQWNSAPQRKGRPFGDVGSTSTSTPADNGWRPSPTSRRPGLPGPPPGPAGGVRAGDEQLVAERDAELRALRATMERNEAAILRAMDDQRRAWEAEAAAERASWERRARDAERRTDDVRTTLEERVRELERQNGALQESVAALQQAAAAAAAARHGGGGARGRRGGGNDLSATGSSDDSTGRDQHKYDTFTHRLTASSQHTNYSQLNSSLRTSVKLIFVGSEQTLILCFYTVDSEY